MVANPAEVLGSANRQLERLVDTTKSARDRTVDFVRAFAIAVVVLWHWTLSIIHWEDGELIMPNPIAVVPGGWLATWLLQVMPVFFFVGGFANLASWESANRDGDGVVTYYRKRLRRLLPPAAVFVAVWVVIEVALFAALPGYRGVLEYGIINFMPLWFLAAYIWVVLLVPLTAPAHARHPLLTTAGLAGAVVLFDLLRFAAGLGLLAFANTALVWVFVHQLGYFYRDGTLRDAPARVRAALALAGLVALAVITTLPAYPRAMVALEGAEVSHMWPTTAGVAALGMFQAGVVLLARPRLNVWLRRRSVWKSVVAVNAVIMTVFLWHMTALLAAIGVLEAFGFDLLAEPTVLWWAQRPIFLLLPAVFLAPLVAMFARFETGALRD